MVKWRQERKRPPRQGDPTVARFSELTRECSAADVLQLVHFEDLCQSVYLLDWPRRAVTHPTLCEIPFFVTFFAARFHRKHRFLFKGRPKLDDILSSCTSFLNKFQWRVTLGNKSSHAPFHVPRAQATPPCPKASHELKVFCSWVRSCVIRQCRRSLSRANCPEFLRSRQTCHVVASL